MVTGSGRPVSLADWRTPARSVWAFHHVDTLVPTAELALAPGEPLPDDASPADPGAVAVPDGAGGEAPLGALLRRVRAKGMVVLREGRVAAQWHDLGYDGRVPHLLFSVSKSLTGLLAGILAGRGLLDPEAPVTRYVPEVAVEGCAYADARVRDLLDMTVSTTFEESYLDRTGGYARYRVATAWNPADDPAAAPNLHSFLAEMPRGAGPHGAAHLYRSPNSDMLGWVLERAGGRPYAALLSDLLWQPLGARDRAYVTLDRRGAARAAGGICATPRDLARLGEMVRLGGRIGGRQVVPADWIADTRAGGDPAVWAAGDHVDLFAEGRYRNQWYAPALPSAPLCAIGIHSQWLWIEPGRGLVIALVAARPEPTETATDQALIGAFGALAETLT
jgi:hypothetical protein